MKITFSPIAKKDLKDIYNYISKDSVRYARFERDRIKSAIDKLYYQPQLGKVFAKFNDERYRELIYSHYSIIYKLSSITNIEILSIHHHSRLISNNPAFKDEE